MSAKIRVKICGFTRHEDAKAAADLGVDAVGLVFFQGSKRCVSIEQAQKIVQVLPPMVSVVALFVNETADNIRHVLANVPIDVLQFHGDESPEFCEQFQRPYWKAVRVANREDVLQAVQTYHSAKAILFDAFVAGEFGGTGQGFDWQLLPEQLPCQWILSGGLNAENVQRAIALTGANSIDVSSGVESSAGIKSAEKIRVLLQAVQNASLSCV